MVFRNTSLFRTILNISFFAIIFGCPFLIIYKTAILSLTISYSFPLPANGCNALGLPPPSGARMRHRNGPDAGLRIETFTDSTARGHEHYSVCFLMPPAPARTVYPSTIPAYSRNTWTQSIRKRAGCEDIRHTRPGKIGGNELLVPRIARLAAQGPGRILFHRAHGIEAAPQSLGFCPSGRCESSARRLICAFSAQ